MYVLYICAIVFGGDLAYSICDFESFSQVLRLRLPQGIAAGPNSCNLQVAQLKKRLTLVAFEHVESVLTGNPPSNDRR